MDDYPELVEVFGGILIKPYARAQPDADLERVYAAIKAMNASPDAPTECAQR